jgi:hypothetical protein
MNISCALILLFLIHLILRCVRHYGGLGLRHMGPAIRQLLKALVVLHGERHAADLALEARLVPDLLQALELLHRVDRLLAFGTCFVHLAYCESTVFSSGRGKLRTVLSG